MCASIFSFLRTHVTIPFLPCCFLNLHFLLKTGFLRIQIFFLKQKKTLILKTEHKFLSHDKLHKKETCCVTKKEDSSIFFKKFSNVTTPPHHLPRIQMRNWALPIFFWDVISFFESDCSAVSMFFLEDLNSELFDDNFFFFVAVDIFNLNSCDLLIITMVNGKWLFSIVHVATTIKKLFLYFWSSSYPKQLWSHKWYVCVHTCVLQ